ncbi:hypothetical protein [uncultured Acetobacteroides sp.]|uniref:hypothetical protein n=1 Tax=uncultured Acetobacteroides sp. TaxID=1760811 RepID=UPI0029F4C6C3|nr:hypothetical protein [uncultured Acetobacteroides sp.]
MKRFAITIMAVLVAATGAFAQKEQEQGTFWQPTPRNYEVKHALEFESLVPMFITGGFHLAACYRYEKFRFRVSVINGGAYDAETAGLNNSSSSFKRYYKTSPGIFAGYNIWKNLEAYTYLEFHTFEIEQKSTGVKKDLRSTDFGAGISYQFFIGRSFYIQPGLHIYLRKDNSLNFGSERYSIPNVDLSPVLRLGFRYWKKF